MPATPSPGKGKPNEGPPSRNTTTTYPSLQQLKTEIENAPGIVKNATDMRNYLTLKQWSQHEQKITCSHMATILLSMLSATATSKTSDKLPEATANMIKAVAFLLDKAKETQNADQPTDQHADQSLPTMPNADTPNQIKESIDNLGVNIQEQLENLQKALNEMRATPAPQHMVNDQTNPNPVYSYRDALLNNQQPAYLPPTNVHKARLQNRINIESRQILMEIQTDSENPIKDDNSSHGKSMGTIKIAANHWLANREGEHQPPANILIRAITLFHAKKILIETNTLPAADWLRLNATRVFNPIIGRPVKTLGRLYPVIA